jgi:hypothetical protein
MANMSYCRWHNTSNDLQDCVNSIETIEEEGFDSLSRDEQRGLLNVVRSAVKLLSQMPVEILAQADIDLNSLPTQEDIMDAVS